MTNTLNNTKLEDGLILPICPWCEKTIKDDDNSSTHTNNFTRTNPSGETYLYHTCCIQDMWRDKIQDDEFSLGEEREVEE